MPIRIYRLTSVSAATAVGQATTVIVARGRIKQVVCNSSAIGGAAAGRITSELALNNSANGNSETATGAPSELLICRTAMSPSSASNGDRANFVVPCDIPVTPGNQICINVMQAVGTAPTSALHGYDVMVNE